MSAELSPVGDEVARSACDENSPAGARKTLLALEAVVFTHAGETPARDEEQAPGGPRSDAAPLLHS